MDHVSISVHDYNRKKQCDLYDSAIEAKGQAYDIVATNELNGWKELSFNLPLMVDRMSNFRWRFIRNEYLLRVKINDKQDWYIIHTPKKTRNNKGIINAVKCSHLSAILKTKNLYLAFDDDNGIDTIGNLVSKALVNSGWSLGVCDTLYERDGATEKIRSISSEGKIGAYQLVTNICNLFNAYPVYNGDDKTVDIHALENKGKMTELHIGKNLNALSVDYSTDDIITRLYVEGEYGDNGYVGIDDVNPTGLSYLLNFDYYKTIGLFTDTHQASLDDYLRDIKVVNKDISTLTSDISKKANALNLLWGQINYVMYRLENGNITDTIVGGTVAEEKRGILADDVFTVMKASGPYRLEKASGSGVLNFEADDIYAIKFFTTKGEAVTTDDSGVSSGTIGAKEVAIEAKRKLIKTLEDKIQKSTDEDEKKKYLDQIDEYQTQIEAIYTDALNSSTGETAYGLYSLMRQALMLASDLFDLNEQKTSKMEAQARIEAVFAKAMGDLLKDGYWSNTNYAAGQEEYLYADAVDMINQISRPAVSYTVSLVPLSASMGFVEGSMELNAKARVYDEELEINDVVYVSKVTNYQDQKNKDTATITNDDITISGKTFDSILGRITQIADLIDQKNSLYNRAETISSDGSIRMDVLNGTIDILKNKLLSSGSSWYTDDKGNIVFESVNGKSAMMLCGEGFMIAYGKTDSGEWNWRTFGTGEGFTADAIITGYLSADRIEARSITANHLASDVGASLDLSSNTSIKLTVEGVVDDRIGYAVEVSSSNGSFLSDKILNTTLSAKITYGVNDKTAETASAKCNWVRFSGNTEADAGWNASHKGTKSVVISTTDVSYQAKYSCVVTIEGNEYSGDISIADLTDTKNVQLFINANLPATQVYDPNTTTYAPDWGTTNLIIKPSVFVNDALDNTSEIVWKKIVGGGYVALDPNWESVNGGILTVIHNTLAETATRIVTYVCEAVYTDSVTAQEINVSERLTFTMLSNAQDGYTPVKGVDYFDGTPGTNGSSSYIHVKYSANADGTAFVSAPTANTKYIGVATTNSTTAPTSKSSYKWTKYVGEDGLPGTPGTDGSPSYLHIAYANSADGSEGFDKSVGTNKLYIGQYTDSNSADSDDPADYTWTQVKGAPGSSAVNLTLYTPNGNVFVNGNGTLLIQASLFDGTVEKTKTQTYIWRQFAENTWTVLTETSDTLSVEGDDISGIGIFECSVTYEEINYIKTITLIDKTDNYQVSISSSNGDVFYNSQGSTVLRCIVYQSGQEVDSDGTKLSYVWTKINAIGSQARDVQPSVKEITVDADDFAGSATFVCTTKNGAMAQITLRIVDNIVESDVAPSDPVVGMLWLDTSSDDSTENSLPKNIIKRWNGTEWINVTVGNTEQDQKLNAKASLEIVNGMIEGCVKTDDMEKYIRFGQKGLELGETGKQLKTVLTNNRLSFFYGTTEVAYISDSNLYITNARVTDTLSVGTSDHGYFDWITLNGGMALKYRT